MSTAAATNRRIKSWPGWFAVLGLAIVLVIYGASRDGGPLTSEERAVAIERSMACPECQGETVFESGHPAAVNIRNEIADLVNAGQLSDEQIIGRFEARFGEDIRLLPKGEGSEAVVWVLPAAVGVAVLGGLIVVFRRWRSESASTAPTADERRRVAAALHAESTASDSAAADSPDSDASASDASASGAGVERT